jgi:hypothetical protein
MRTLQQELPYLFLHLQFYIVEQHGRFVLAVVLSLGAILRRRFVWQETARPDLSQKKASCTNTPVLHLCHKAMQDLTVQRPFS